jgi:hypothetical protein
MRFLVPAGLAGAALAGLLLGQATVRGMTPVAVAEADTGWEEETASPMTEAVACLECRGRPAAYDDQAVPSSSLVSWAAP